MLYKEGLFDVCEVLTRVQCCLQDVGAHVATPPDSLKSKIEKTKFDESLFDYVNAQIDVYGDRVPPIRQFILPGGGDVGATLQVARSICRRAERCLVPLLREEVIDKNALRFLNRFSYSHSLFTILIVLFSLVISSFILVHSFISYPLGWNVA
uniref:Cobalamin adenosyltransferase-like domain-containing protein n=1 Tax=Parascaris equorum TaxID=6256 RepID=A0A914RBU0_PAREQ